MDHRPVSVDRWTTIIVIVLTNPYCSLAIICHRPIVTLPLQITTDPYKQILQYNESIEFGCVKGYSISGDTVRYCTQNGTFKLNFPTCSAIKCQPPSLKYPLQITTYKQIFRYNESIEFHCAANYHIQGEAVRYCTQNDSFQQNLPTCSVITCQRPCLSEALQLTTDPHQQTYSYNESIVFNCSPGYTLHGPSIKYCLQNGDFNKRLPYCSVNRAQDTQQSLTVAILAGCAIGLVVFSSATIVIIITSRRLRKQKENVNYEEGIRQSEDKDHEYTGIKQQSYDNTASYVVTGETPDNRDHQYTELKVKPDEWTKTDALT
nr:P-selectin [Crassostrea gigas]